MDEDDWKMCIRDRIYRSGIESIPKGQYEAATLLGYSRGQTFFRIVLPQMVKNVLPSVTNEVITLVKDTSLVYSLSYICLLYTSRNVIGAVNALSSADMALAGITSRIPPDQVIDAMKEVEMCIRDRAS